MSVAVTIVEGPLGPGAARGREGGRVGAVVVFEGVVRGEEGGRSIDGLRYEAYRPMADRELARLGQEVVERYGVESVEVEHSVGWVPVGACSFRLVVRAGHRAEALSAAGAFIEAMKRDVPIWKRGC